jgi:hypothetical protein
MLATSHRRRSWKDSPTAKAIAATISLIAGLIAVLAFSLLSMQWGSRVLGLKAKGEMKEAANWGGLASFLATDILDCIIEPLDELGDPLIFLQKLRRAHVWPLVIFTGRYLRRWTDHDATSPSRSALRWISFSQTVHMKVCNSES